MNNFYNFRLLLKSYLAEHKSLLQVIRETQNENKVEVVDKLFMRIQYPKSICTGIISLLPANIIAVILLVIYLFNMHFIY